LIALTGAGGFIGSVILKYLNDAGIDDVYVFDDLSTGDQFRNLVGKRYISLHSTKEIVTDFASFDAVIHFGANSSTLEKDWSSIYETNVLSTRQWHDLCAEHDKKFIFASSAAVYGNGIGPLNHYAFSKLSSEQEITNGVVLRLFNVYGPNEYHKGRMASTIYHWFQQLRETGEIKIFKGSDQYYRDFVYVEDVAKVVLEFLRNYKPGIYDLGTGHPTSFETVADTIIEKYGHGKKNYITMPLDLKNQYQRYTCADTDFLKSNISVDFKNIDEGIESYIEYLKSNRYF
jgi:ADP-L-glycero-D-manno-heptose 6-epimerase